LADRFWGRAAMSQGTQIVMKFFQLFNTRFHKVKMGIDYVVDFLAIGFWCALKQDELFDFFQG
jgi:hypothetical protein